MPQQMRARRTFTYNTRRLLPGDVFEVMRPSDVRILKAIRKAEEVRPEANVPPPPPALAARIAQNFPPAAPAGVVEASRQINDPERWTDAERAATRSDAPAEDDLKAAREEYRAALGRPPYHAWDAATLREKIAAAKPPLSE